MIRNLRNYTPERVDNKLAKELVIQGDCLNVLKTFEDNSIDAVVTDPPYGLSKEPDIREVLTKWLNGEPYDHGHGGFMGKSWDSFVPHPDIWREVYRVLKPGGHALVFAGTRTQDLMTIALRLAGFEVRDVIEWLYFSGFPKSMDVSKAFDKAGGSRWASREFSRRYAEIVRNSPYTHSDIDRMLGIKSSSCYWAREDYRGGMPPRHHWEKLCEILPIPDDFKRFYDEAEREKIGERSYRVTENSTWGQEVNGGRFKIGTHTYDITDPATDLAKKWAGWGTALKPAHEPIIMVRKPFKGAVADCVEKYGTGAINIDACRIEMSEEDFEAYKKKEESFHNARKGKNVYGGNSLFPSKTIHENKIENKGRFPANCITLDDDAFYSKYFNITPKELSKKASKKDRNSDWKGEEIALEPKDSGVLVASTRGQLKDLRISNPEYERKVPKNANTHPTVKPTDLMAWLVRLSTPPNGVVLDPFAGSGSTLVAAKREGFGFIGIEREPGYVEIIEARTHVKAIKGDSLKQSNNTTD